MSRIDGIGNEARHAEEERHGDEERRGQDYPRRQGTDGPGGAALFYDDERKTRRAQNNDNSSARYGDAHVRGNSVIGTGTDGFGAGVSTEGMNVASTSSRSLLGPVPPPAYDEMPDRWAASSGQDQQYGHPPPLQAAAPAAIPPTSNARPYTQPAYAQQQRRPHQDVNSSYTTGVGVTDHRYDPDMEAQYYAANSQTPYDHQYPPLSTPFYDATREDEGAPGVYLHRAPDYEKLNDEQKEIADTFPKDLDEDGGSMVNNIKRKMLDWRSWLKWRYTHYYIIIVLLCALLALMTIYHRKIIDWLTPVSKKARSLAWGWVIPVVILFIISFPPLFGHEIVGVLCGVVYGLWIGFGILSLGTLLGELGNFIVFRFFLLKHAAKAERKSLDYACMAHIVREGGFLVILLARLSAIPGHFTTAVFATVGMNIFIFTIAAILSLPKQLVVVYLGVAIEASGDGTESTSSKIIKYAVLFASALVTVLVALFLYHKMQKARPTVQKRMREERYRLLVKAASPVLGDTMSAFGSDEDSQSTRVKLEASGSSATPYYSQGGVDIRSTDRLASPSDERSGMDLKPIRKQRKPGMWSRMRGQKKAQNDHSAVERQVSNQSSQIMFADGAKASFETDSLAHEDLASGSSQARGVQETGVPYIRANHNYSRGVDPQHVQSGRQHDDQSPYYSTAMAFDVFNERAMRPIGTSEHGGSQLPDNTANVPGRANGAVALQQIPATSRIPKQAHTDAQFPLQPTSDSGQYRHVAHIGSVYDYGSEMNNLEPAANSRQQLPGQGVWREPSID